MDNKSVAIMPTRICLIRHGETGWNAAKRIQGQTDIPLNEAGQAQALALARNAAHHEFAAIYSSDLCRAHATAQRLAEGRGLGIRTLPQLRERHYGIFQGVTAAEGARRYPEAHARYKARDLDYDFQTGESLLGFAERVSEAVELMALQHSGQTIAAVCHAGVLDIVYRKATGRPLHSPRDFAIPNCALNWFRFENRGDAQEWYLESWDDQRDQAGALHESAE